MSPDSKKMTTSPDGHATLESGRSNTQVKDFDTMMRRNIEIKEQKGLGQVSNREVGTLRNKKVTLLSGIGQDLTSDMVAFVPMDEYMRVLNKITTHTRKILTQTDHRNLVAVIFSARTQCTAAT